MTSAFLHILAMGLMMLDHLWATVIPGNDWMTWLGRLAFPIFAFLIAEGYRRTKDVKKYRKRLLLFALISEIPMNLMTMGSFINPFHQNVLWTFLIALQCMIFLDQLKDSRWRYVGSFFVCLAGFLLGYVSFADYYGAGVLTVLVFYFFHKKNVWHLLGQVLCLYILHVHLLGGFTYIVELGRFEIGIVQQGMALLSLLPIWLYRGRQGYHAPWFRKFCYWFYPAHMLVLYLIWFNLT